MKVFTRSRAALPGTVMVLALGAATAPAQAGVQNALGQAWNCAKATAKANLVLPKVVIQKGDQLAALGATTSTCMAEAGADPQGFALISGVIVAVKIASPGAIPNGQCLDAVKKDVAKPIALGLGAVLPSGSVKDGLLQAASSETAADTLWSQMEVMPPPVSTLVSHASCACKIIDGGLDLLDTSEVTSAIGEVSSSCAGFLDAAGLGFINTYGGKTIHWTEQEWTDFTGYWDQLKGEKLPAPDEVVYQWYYGSMVEGMAKYLAANGGDVGTHAVTPPYYSSNYSYSTASSTVATVNMAQMLDNCVNYYDNHTMSKSSALEVCNKWQARYPVEVATEVTRLKAITAFLLFADGLPQHLYDDYAIRFPKHVLSPTSTEANHGVTSWSKGDTTQILLPIAGQVKFGYDHWSFEGTGVYQSGMRILPTVGYSTAGAQTAFNLAYAGLRPAINAAIYKQWKLHSPEVRYLYLPKILPNPGAFSGPYGCPATGPLADKCTHDVEVLFDLYCNPDIARGWVEGTDSFNIVKRVNAATDSCHARLQPAVDAANVMADDLPEFGNHVKANCQATPRSEAQTACLNGWTDLWKTCRTQAYSVPYGSAKDRALACLDKGTFRALNVALPAGYGSNPGNEPGGRPSAPIVPVRGGAVSPASAPTGTLGAPKTPSATATSPGMAGVRGAGAGMGVKVPVPASAASTPAQRLPVRIGG